jgi:hypothetical protein
MSSSPFPPPPIAPAQRQSSMIKWLLALGGLVLVVLAWSCGTRFYRDYGICRSAADRFHQHLNRSEYESIYNEASEDLRAEAPETDQIKVFQTVHEKMGIAGKMKPLGFHVNANANTKGTFANQVYETEFSLGKAEEQFVWRIKVNDALLVSYHAESSNFR